MTTVAIAGCRVTADAAATELYPDPDAPLLADALAAIGLSAVTVAWDDPDADWDAFATVVLSSTWDYVERPDDFVRWAHGRSRLLNPAAVVAANIDKRYLIRVVAAGLPVVPTTWLQPGDHWDGPDDDDVVVKPSISGGGRDTAWYRSSERAAARAHVERLHSAGRTVMVQPHQPGVDTDGEVKLVFIGGRFSHAVRVGPSLVAGEGVVEHPWERQVSTTIASPTAAELLVARRALSLWPPLTYARVDLLPGPMVIEVEVIEPSLFLPYAPHSADRLATAIAAHVDDA